MRKKFLSYITMVIVMFVVGVNVVKAEDYNFSTKVYKVDVVDDNFITRFNNGEFQEVKSGGTLNAGDTIAVGVYADTINPTSHAFDIKLNWDDSLLEPIFKSSGLPYFKNDLRGTCDGGLFPAYLEYGDCDTYWQIERERTYYINNYPVIGFRAYDNQNYLNFNASGILQWVFYKVKANISDNTYINFNFKNVTGFKNNGRDEVSISTSFTTFKINGNKVSAYSLGDANGNGKIDFGDVMLSMAFYMANLSMNAEEKDAADMNNDGRVTLSDTLLIIEKLFENN